MTSRGRLHGVTLIEMLVVLMLMGLAAAFVVPSFGPGPSTAELRSAARQVAAGLRLVRNVAVSQRRAAVLEVDLEKRTFRIDREQRARPFPDGVAIELRTARRDVVNERVGNIRFYPDGGSNGGRISLLAGERRYEIDVDWLTGRVAILD